MKILKYILLLTISVNIAHANTSRFNIEAKLNVNNDFIYKADKSYYQFNFKTYI